jgi:hypothetical protein
MHVLAAFDGDNGFLGRASVWLEIDVAIDAAVGSLLFAAVGYCINERNRPPLELILVLRRERPRTSKVMPGKAS